MPRRTDAQSSALLRTYTPVGSGRLSFHLVTSELPDSTVSIGTSSARETRTGTSKLQEPCGRSQWCLCPDTPRCKGFRMCCAEATPTGRIPSASVTVVSFAVELHEDLHLRLLLNRQQRRNERFLGFHLRWHFSHRVNALARCVTLGQSARCLSHASKVGAPLKTTAIRSASSQGVAPLVVGIHTLSEGNV